jgi:hypothetical protein
VLWGVLEGLKLQCSNLHQQENNCESLLAEAKLNRFGGAEVVAVWSACDLDYY